MEEEGREKSQAGGADESAAVVETDQGTGKDESQGSTDSPEQADDHEDVVNVHQFYPEIDILTSTVISDSNVAETEDYKFGNEELPNVTITDDSESRDLVPVGEKKNEGETSETKSQDGNETVSLDVTETAVALRDEKDSKKKTDQFFNGTVSCVATLVDDYNNSGRAQNNTDSFPGTQSFQEYEGEMAEVYRVISPDLDMVEIINSKAAEHYQNALRCEEEGDLQRAIQLISKDMSLQPDQSLYFVKKAEIFLELCDFQSAILNYKKACFLEPNNADIFHRLAFVFYFQGQVFFDQRLYAEALESFSRASEMLPEKTGFHTRSIACLAALQRHGECLSLVNRQLEVDKQNPDLYIMRARLHEMFSNMTLCYYDVKDALALDPEHSEALALKSKLEGKAEENKTHSMQLCIMGKQREALQKISVAMEMNPAVAEYHVLRGALHRKLGDFNAAIDDFLLALDKAGHQEDAVYVDSQRQLLLTYNDFAVECFTKGYYEEAVILLNKAVKGEKQEKGLYINRGDCFFRQGELTFALQDYHQALELDRLDEDVKARISVIHSEFGVTAYHNKNYPEAESKFSLAIQYNPLVGQYFITRSRCRYMLEDMTGARTDLVMGLFLDPTNEEIMSIFSRLFPGKSLAEVRDSGLGQRTRQALGNLRPSASPIRLHPLPQTPALIPLPQDFQPQPAKSSPATRADISAPGLGDPPDRLTLKTPALMSNMTSQKKKIKQEVKMVLKDRKSLMYDGPRLQPLPPPTHPPKGNKTSSREKVAVDATKSKGSSTNWRKFTVGVGSLTAL